MLYQLHELQRRLLNPMTAFAEGASSLYSNPASPWSYMPFSREISASYELLHRLGKDYSKPAFGLTETAVRLCRDHGGPKRARELRNAGTEMDIPAWMERAS